MELIKTCCMCRAHFNLGNLTPGETADLWLDINVPKKSGSENKGRERKRDKVLDFFVGAKGNQEKDVENCQVHIQVSLIITWPTSFVKGSQYIRNQAI